MIRFFSRVILLCISISISTVAFIATSPPLYGQNNDMEDNAAISALPDATKSSEPAAPPPSSLAQTNRIDAFSWDAPSFMFNPKRLQDLFEAISAYESGEDIEEEFVVPEPVLEEAPVEIVHDDSPPITFFLNSIVYFSKGHWAIWVNNTKLTPDNATGPENIEVTQVTNKEVQFTWKPRGLNKIAPGWTGRLVKQENKRFVSEEHRIAIDANNGTVEFTLFPNQTFLPRDMAVLEGEFVANNAAALHQHKQPLENDSSSENNNTAPSSSSNDPQSESAEKLKSLLKF